MNQKTTAIMKKLLVLILIISSCKSSSEDRIQKQMDINAQMEMMQKRLDFSLTQHNNRMQLMKAMTSAGYSEDSINKKMNDRKIEDSIELNTLFDTTTLNSNQIKN